jgi:hypothetical protein
MERGLAIGTAGFSLCGNAAITSMQCLRELSSKQIVTTVSLDIMRNLATSHRCKGGVHSCEYPVQLDCAFLPWVISPIGRWWIGILVRGVPNGHWQFAHYRTVASFGVAYIRAPYPGGRLLE